MFLTEIEEGQSLTISVLQGEERAEFDSVAVMQIEEGLLIESIRHNNQLVNFKHKNVNISLTVNLNPLPVRFDDVNVDAVKYKGNIYHLVKAKLRGEEVNRRGGFRVFIGETGYVQINGQGEEKTITVKDVSISGFSIVSSEELQVGGGTIKLTYVDDEQKILLRGVVVRQEELPNSKILYGCELLHTPSSFGKYLNKKQMDKKSKSAEQE